MIKIICASDRCHDHRKVDDHLELRDQMDTFNHIFSELKNEFKLFLQKAY